MPVNADAHSMFLYCRYAWLIFLAIWLIAAAKTKPAVRAQAPWSRWLVSFTLAVAYVLLFTRWLSQGILGEPFLPRTDPNGYLGFALTIAGIAFACWARLYLGGNWSSSVTVKRNHELIRTGPYAFVRHPIYTGILLAFFGTAIARGNIGGLLALVLAAAVLRGKSRIEEGFMQKEFPAEYPRYMRQVKAIVPLLW